MTSWPIRVYDYFELYWPGEVFAGAVVEDGATTEIGQVIEGATTPWSWASLPGVRRYFTVCGPVYLYLGHDSRERIWLTTERRYERRP